MKVTRRETWAALLLCLGACAEDGGAEPRDGAAPGPGVQDGALPDASGWDAAATDGQLSDASADAGGDASLSDASTDDASGDAAVEQGTTPRPSKGCSGGSLKPGDSSVTIASAGGNRSYVVHVPASYGGDVPVPLVYDFHGGTINADIEKLWSGWDKVSDQQGFIVVYPNSYDGFWKAGGSFGSTPDDVQFTRDMTAELFAKGCIDQRRVYATGWSMGGAMTFRLACLAADLFAAYGPMGAGVPPAEVDGCKPARPASLMLTIGKNDPLNAWDGVPAGPGINALGVRDLFRDRNGCSDAAHETYGKFCSGHEQCSAGVEVHVCLVNGGHDAWGNSDNFNIPSENWKLFERMRLP